MSEQWQTGNPPAEAWWECEIDCNDKFHAFWWKGRWYKDRTCKTPVAQEIMEVLRFRGPLILAPEPSQGARERTEKICGKIISEGRFGCFEFILHHITAAEKVAFQLGKEEGRREAEIQYAGLVQEMNFIGGKMANICFNGKQKLPSEFSEVMKREQENWDAIYFKYSSLLNRAIGTSTGTSTEPAEPDRLTALQQRVQKLEEKK